jgi:hypothetical protein
MSSEKRLSRDEVSAHVIKLVAEALPKGFLEECVEASLRKAIGDFKVESYEITKILNSVILERTKVLIATKYQAQIEARAEELAQRAMGGGR